MNPTISIHLSGTVFHVEEKAYALLNDYLERIRRVFQSAAGGEEIIADIQSRMAEMFLEKLQTSGQQALTYTDIESVLQQMGQPENFAEDAQDASIPSQTEVPKDSFQRGLYRDADDRIMGGVCAGLAAWLGTDPIWIRLLFAGLFFGFGTGVFLYLILWIIMPVARTRAEKLRMQGKPVNLDNLTQFVKTEYASIKDATQDEKSGLRTTTNRIADAGVEIIRVLLKIITLGVSGFAFVIAGILLISLLVMAFLAFIVPEYNNPLYFLSSFSEWSIGVMGLVGLLGIPLSILLWICIKFWFKIPKVSSLWMWSSLGVWIVCLGLTLYSTTLIANDFSSTGKITERKIIPLSPNTPLILKVSTLAQPHRTRKWLFDKEVWIETESGKQKMAYSDIDITFEKSPDSLAYLEIIRTARGGDPSIARGRAELIHYDWKLRDSLLEISPVAYGIDKWRAQEISMILYLPEGKKISIAPELEMLIDYSFEDSSGPWNCEMRKEGLYCPDGYSEDEESFSEGNIQELNFKNFSEITVEGAVEVHIRKGTEFKVSLEGELKNDKSLSLSQQGKRLTIKGKNEDMENIGVVYITLPELKELNLSGAVKVFAKEIEENQFIADINGASKLELSGNISDLALQITGASTAELEGRSDKLTLTGKGACKIEAMDWNTKEATVELEGASVASLTVKRSLSADLNGASHFTYAGEPSIRKIRTQGAAKASAE